MPLHVVLYRPEIPQNTGNIARTCAATGCKLHLIRPLGFAVTDKHLKRAGLDYWADLDLAFHDSWTDFLEEVSPRRIWLSTTRGTLVPHRVSFHQEDALVFGQESVGLPAELHEAYPHHRLRLPMREGARSLNLSNAVAILVYEALRQLDWPGLQT